MYGLLISLSILICIFLAKRLADKQKLDVKLIWQLAFWTIIGGVLGARVYHVATDWAYYILSPVKILYIWNGGLGIFGGIAGGVAAVVIFFHIKKQPIKPWLNILGVIAPLGQSIGRWGNFFNNELWGKSLENGFFSSACRSKYTNEVFMCAYKHPVFLYESVLTFLLFISLLVVYFKKSLNYSFYLYIIGYSVIRFFVEFFKDGTQPLNATQILCLILFICASLKLFIDIKSRKT